MAWSYNKTQFSLLPPLDYKHKSRLGHSGGGEGGGLSPLDSVESNHGLEVEIVAKQAGKLPGCQTRVESSGIKPLKDPLPPLRDLSSQSFPTLFFTLKTGLA